VAQMNVAIGVGQSARHEGTLENFVRVRHTNSQLSALQVP
jgi:hypothetical protein